MKVFAINETEWVAAETKEEALDYEDFEESEVESIEEIPESEWDEEVEYITEDSEDETDTEKTTIRQMLMVQSDFPCKIMTEAYCCIFSFSHPFIHK